jgi:hypothetical protein
MDLVYEAKFFDIMAGGPHKPEFLVLNPNRLVAAVLKGDG